MFWQQCIYEFMYVCYTLASKWTKVDIPVKICTWELLGSLPTFYYCAITAFSLPKIKSTYFRLFFCLFSQVVSQHFEGILGRVMLNISVWTFSLKSRGKNNFNSLSEGIALLSSSFAPLSKKIYEATTSDWSCGKASYCDERNKEHMAKHYHLSFH